MTAEQTHSEDTLDHPAQLDAEGKKNLEDAGRIGKKYFDDNPSIKVSLSNMEGRGQYHFVNNDFALLGEGNKADLARFRELHAWEDIITPDKWGQYKIVIGDRANSFVLEPGETFTLEQGDEEMTVEQYMKKLEKWKLEESGQRAK